MRENSNLLLCKNSWKFKRVMLKKHENSKICFEKKVLTFKFSKIESSFTFLAPKFQIGILLCNWEFVYIYDAKVSNSNLSWIWKFVYSQNLEPKFKSNYLICTNTWFLAWKFNSYFLNQIHLDLATVGSMGGRESQR